MKDLKNLFGLSVRSAMLVGVAASALSLVSVDFAHAQGNGQGGSSSSAGGGGNSGGGSDNAGGGSSGGGSDNAGGANSGGSDNAGGGSDNGQGASGGQSASGGQGGADGAGGAPADGPSEEADEDSDRPSWAGGNPELNPHAGAGSGNPESGTTKGDIYGDIVVLFRDPATGEPIVAGTTVDENGEEITEYWICVDPACMDYAGVDPNEIPEGVIVSTELGEIPAGVTAIEVEFGRSSVARAPDSVTDHALEEALGKLEDAEEVALDVSGRIVYSIDGVWYTIDSPLENLALYTDLSAGLASDATSATEAALDAAGLATLDMAASLLAGVADKTGDITLDYLVNENVIAGVVEPGDYYEYSTFEYTRDYPTDYEYWVSIDGALPTTAVLDINAYLADASVNGALPDSADSAALFAAAADDALEVIELVHTQIHTEILPGTVE